MYVKGVHVDWGTRIATCFNPSESGEWGGGGRAVYLVPIAGCFIMRYTCMSKGYTSAGVHVQQHASIPVRAGSGAGGERLFI